MLNSLIMARPTASTIPGSRPIVSTPSVVTIERSHSMRARRKEPTERREVEEPQHGEHDDRRQPSLR